MADVAQGIVGIEIDPGVIERGCNLGEIPAAGFHDAFVDFHQVYSLYTVVFDQFIYYPSVSGTEDQDALGVRIHCHRHVGKHFVVDELIPFGEDDVAVHCKHPSELQGVEDIHPSEIVLVGIEVLVHLDGELYIACVMFTEPKFHSSR